MRVLAVRHARTCRTADSGCSLLRVSVSFTLARKLIKILIFYRPILIPSGVQQRDALQFVQLHSVVAGGTGSCHKCELSNRIRLDHIAIQQCAQRYVHKREWHRSVAHQRRRLMCRYTICPLTERVTVQCSANNSYSGLLVGDDRRHLQLFSAIARNGGNCHVGVVSCGIRVESGANWRRTQRHVHECERQRPMGSYR